MQKSTSLRPSSSHNEEPSERFTKNGYGSKYRTGLLTPEGITFFASENNFLELFNIFLIDWGIINLTAAMS